MAGDYGPFRKTEIFISGIFVFVDGQYAADAQIKSDGQLSITFHDKDVAKKLTEDLYGGGGDSLNITLVTKNVRQPN